MGKNKKNKIMAGGTLLELEDLDISKKTIILVGEVHTHITIQPQYNNAIRKQKDIIDRVIAKFGKNKTYFYSEAPCAFKEHVLETKIYSACAVVQYANSKMPIKLSNICDNKREEKGMCDCEYADDILSIFDKNIEVDCIIVQIGLAHIVELKKHIEKRPEINIIIVNTASPDQITRLWHVLTNTWEGFELLEIEKPYHLQEEGTFNCSNKIPKEADGGLVRNGGKKKHRRTKRGKSKHRKSKRGKSKHRKSNRKNV